MKIKQRARDKYVRYLSLCRDDEPRPLRQLALTEGGRSALEAFHIWESTGTSVPTSEPLLLEKYRQGKIWHGVTVAAVAEAYVERLVFSKEIKSDYPAWVADEIFSAAARIALERPTLGYVPTFIRDKRDFSEMVRALSGEWEFAE